MKIPERSDFDQIILTPRETKLLRKIRSKGTMDVKDGHELKVLLHLRLVRHTEETYIDGYMFPKGPCTLTDKGVRYCACRKQQRWAFAAKSAWIPIIVTLAADLLKDEVKQWLPQIQIWLSSILK